MRDDNIISIERCAHCKRQDGELLDASIGNGMIKIHRECAKPYLEAARARDEAELSGGKGEQ
jgi:hypothetical protein